MAASVVCRSLSILGRATFTTDSSTNAIVDPSTAATSTQVRRAVHAGTLAAARMAAWSQGRIFGLAIGGARAVGSAAREVLERRAAHAHDGPLILRDRADAAVEGDRRRVPVEYRPVEPRAAALERRAREPRQQAPADAAAARLRAHEQVLEVDAGLAEQGREVVEEQGEADRGTVQAGKHHLRVRARTEERGGEIRRGRGHLVLQALVHRQLTDELEH